MEEIQQFIESAYSLVLQVWVDTDLSQIEEIVDLFSEKGYKPKKGMFFKGSTKIKLSVANSFILKALLLNKDKEMEEYLDSIVLHLDYVLFKLKEESIK